MGGNMASSDFFLLNRKKKSYFMCRWELGIGDEWNDI